MPNETIFIPLIHVDFENCITKTGLESLKSSAFKVQKMN